MIFYYRNRKWHRIPKIAKEWYKKYDDINALYYLAQSQIQRKYPKKTLKTLNQIEETHDLLY